MIARNFGIHKKETGIVFRAGVGPGAGRLFGGHQRLVQPARGLGAQNVCQHFQRGIIRVRPRRNVISDRYEADITDAPQHHGAFAILRGFHGVAAVEFSFRPRQLAKIFFRQPQGFGLIKFPGNDEDDIIRLIIFFVKGLKIFHGHVFNIATIADGGFAVIVPVVRGGGDAFVENVAR